MSQPRAVPPLIARVDAVRAHRIAETFLAAPRMSSDPLVNAAYDDLATQAARWFDRLTGAAARAPIRVVYTRDSEPYATGNELAQRVPRERVLELWPSRYDRDRRHPLLDASVGGAFDRMRAVHDIVSHAGCGFEFDRDGEYSAWRFEHRMYTGLARWALATELHAEHSVLWTTGSPAVHKAMLLPPGLLATSLDAGVG